MLLLAVSRPAPPPGAPVLVTPPAITPNNNTVVGVQVDFGNGRATGTPFPTVLNWRWQSGPSSSGPWTTVATTHKYTFVTGDVGSYFRILIDWVNAAGTITVASPDAGGAAIGPVTAAAGPPAPTSPPSPPLIGP